MRAEKQIAGKGTASQKWGTEAWIEPEAIPQGLGLIRHTQAVDRVVSARFPRGKRGSLGFTLPCVASCSVMVRQP